MYKNYFYLFRNVLELEKFLCGLEIIEIYTQEKDKLFLNIPLHDNPHFHLIISINPQHPFLLQKENQHKAKKNTVNFFEDAFPCTIKSVSIAEGDRIVRIAITIGNIYIVFRGTKSNVYFIDEASNITSFKKCGAAEGREFLQEINQLHFSNSLSWISEILNAELTKNDLKKMPFLGKEITNELELRNDNSRLGIQKIIREIISEPIAIYYDELNNQPCFYPRTFKLIRNPKDIEYCTNYYDALNKYLGLRFSKSRSKISRTEIEKFLLKEIERLSTKLNKLKARIEAGSKEKLYRQYGDVLLTNINSIKKGMKSISLEDFNSGEEVHIVLDEKMSPNQNVERYFDKSRNEKLDFLKSKELFTVAEREYNRLIQIRKKFEDTDSLEELQLIKKELKMDAKTPQLEYKNEKYSFRHYLIEEKYNAFVGKDSKNNDALTTKFAKQNDFWFHARSVSGSHVVLRVENSKDPIPKSILQKAASLAAFYSKAKSSKLAPVTFTLKKYVVKNSRHEPGQVTVTKENVLLVRPEIPKDCILVED